jgi:2-phospho-L-lactate transferase/gluconeogenesis factor (CofD/UPF0052 family)
VAGAREAIMANTIATKILVVNATNKKGLTDGWSTRDYLACVEKEIGAGMLTHCIANTTEAPDTLQEKYRAEEGAGVFVGRASLPTSCTPVYTHLLKKYPTDALEQFIRHDEHLLAREIIRIVSS